MSTLEVPVRHDEHGAAVWETRNVDTFALKGDPAKTQKTIEKVSSEFCKGPSRMVGGGTSGGVLRVKEAFKRAAKAAIVLVRHPPCRCCAHRALPRLSDFLLRSNRMKFPNDQGGREFRLMGSRDRFCDVILYGTSELIFMDKLKMLSHRFIGFP